MNHDRDPTSTSLIAFLESLYVPKSKSEKFAKLMEMAKRGDVREWTQEDQGILIHALEIETRGKSPRRSFSDFSLVFIDTGKMGKKMGEIAVSRNSLGRSIPMKFKYSAHKFVILETF